MPALLAPLAAAAALLVVAGAPKVLRPLPAVRALRSAGRRVPPALVRVAGGAEAGLGLATLAFGGRPAAALVAASYAGFTGFVLLARRRGGVLSSCGCFGRADPPATGSHAVVTAGFALLCAGATIWPVTPQADPVALALAALVGWLGYVALAVQPLATGRAVRSAAART